MGCDRFGQCDVPGGPVGVVAQLGRERRRARGSADLQRPAIAVRSDRHDARRVVSDGRCQQ